MAAIEEYAEGPLVAGSGPKLAFPKIDLHAIKRHYLERPLLPSCGKMVQA